MLLYHKTDLTNVKINMLIAELTRAEGRLAELHTRRTMPSFFMGMASEMCRAGLDRGRDVAQG